MARSPTIFLVVCQDLGCSRFFCFLGRNSEYFLGFFFDLDKKSNIFLGSLVKILDVLGFFVFLAGIPKIFLNFPTILTKNPTIFLVFLSRSWIVFVFLFSCQEIRKNSWIFSLILEKVAYLVKNNCKDLGQKSHKSENFLGE